MAERMRAFDWAGTSIGPVQRWPQSLRMAVGICLASRHPMVIWWGPQLVLLYNDAWVPILGPSKHPALGKPGAGVWPEMWHIIGEQMRSVLATGEATWSDDQLLPAMRFGYLEEAYFTYSYSAIHDETGAVAGVFTAVTETTSRVLGERRLRTMRELGEVSAVTAPSAERACAAALEVLSGNRADLPFALIYLLAADGRSARLVGGYGIAADAAGAAIAPPTVPHPDGDDLVWQVAGNGRPEVVTGLSLRYPAALLAGVTEVGEADPDTAVVLPLAGAGLDHPAGVLVAGISPFRALDEDYRGFCDLVAGHVAAAVADARAYESERGRAEALAELDRAKTEFFSNVSHEFRTPLTLIMGPVAELRSAQDVDPPRLRTELEVIYRNGLRLGKLVNTLLDFSRIQAGRVQAHYEPLDLGACTAELASVFRSAVERAGLRLEVDWADLGEPVYVDWEMWEKVVLNLLSNALKFTFDGHITVTVRRAGESAMVAVADTGTGIPAEELPRLFDRFHRIRGARSRSHEGSGIGLALVAELVALHDGTISAESTPGVGTTFTVTLPLGSAHLPADQIMPASTVIRASHGAAPFVEEALRWLPDAPDAPDDDSGVRLIGAEPLGPAGGRVLVADDNADMREYLQRLLGARYDVQAVSDGVGALRAAQTDPPDLIVSDVMMPGMDGLQLVAALRADPRTARVPVLLLSARAGQEAAAEGLTAGADDYVVKPFTAGELLARVGAHLQLGRLRRRAEQRLELLQQATAALSAAATPADVAQAAITHLAHLLDAPAVILYEVRETGTLECVARRGWAPEVESNWFTVPLSALVPAADAARRCGPVWLESPADTRAAYPDIAPVIAGYGYQAHVDLPLVIGDRCVGVVAAALHQPRRFDEAERAAAVLLAEQCAQALHRAQLLATETTARVMAERLNRLVGALSGATGVTEVVEVILDYAGDLGAAAAVVVWRRSVDGQPTVLAARGYPEPPARLAIDAAHPLAHVMRAKQPVWLGSRSSVAWHDDAFDSDGPLPVQVAVPLITGDTAFGALGLRFADAAPTFTAHERAMILTLGGQCAQALDRARLYQAEHAIAQTLQHSLLPGQMPTFDRLALATRYLPGAPDVAAGGDWYDVMALDEHQVAIVVGDVVGQGAAAAAVMGQLRTALAAYLLDGHGPAAALERLDRLATRVPGALASTAAVMIIDLNSGQLCWARAGHPPPLLVDHHHVGYLTDGAGGPLGVPRRPPYPEASTRIEPGACLLLYTDGLIERRGQVIDEGLDHLAATATKLCGRPPTTLLDGLLARALPNAGPADDIALIAALYLPAPLHQRLPADPEQLPGLRRVVRGWIRAAALPAAVGDDLQITLGEAAANSVEHAYATAGEPGEFTYRVTHRGDGAIDVEVRDFGRWRPHSPGNHHRGRGLVILREIATDVAVDPSPEGTRVQFRLPGPAPDPEPPAPILRGRPTPDPSPAPAELHVHSQPDGGQRLELRGELDLAAATVLRERLLEALTGPGPTTLDLRGLTYLSSAGIGLVIHAVQHAAEHDIRLLQLAPDSLAARILALTNLDATVPVVTDVSGSA